MARRERCDDPELPVKEFINRNEERVARLGADWAFALLGAFHESR